MSNFSVIKVEFYFEHSLLLFFFFFSSSFSSSSPPSSSSSFFFHHYFASFLYFFIYFYSVCVPKTKIIIIIQAICLYSCISNVQFYLESDLKSSSFGTPFSVEIFFTLKRLFSFLEFSLPEKLKINLGDFCLNTAARPFRNCFIKVK